MEKHYNATADGQKEMCAKAASFATWAGMNKKIRELGGIGWDPEMIASANPTLMEAIKADLVSEYNSLITKS